MSKLKVLCVCLENVNRSPRAALVLERLVEERGIKNVEIESAGTNAWVFTDPDLAEQEYGVWSTMQLSRTMALSADLVIGLDGYVCQDLFTNFNVPYEKIRCLRIPDEYSKRKGNLQELYDLLERRLTPIADSLRDQA